METRRDILLAALCIALSACQTTPSEKAVLTEEPRDGDLAHREVVYVDDGVCPAGELKRVTGRSLGRGIERKRDCVPDWRE